jgi:hypothetical protein
MSNSSSCKFRTSNTNSRTPCSQNGQRDQLPPHLEAVFSSDRKSYERSIDPTRLARDRSLHATRTMPPITLHEATDHYRTQRHPSGHDSASEDLDFLGSSHGFQSLDLNDHLEFTSCLAETSHGTNSPTSVSIYRKYLNLCKSILFSSAIYIHIHFLSVKSQRDVEAEMRRLRLELKQTMDMYSAACREAMTAKQKVRFLQILVADIINLKEI